SRNSCHAVDAAGPTPTDSPGTGPGGTGGALSSGTFGAGSAVGDAGGARTERTAGRTGSGESGATRSVASCWEGVGAGRVSNFVSGSAAPGPSATASPPGDPIAALDADRSGVGASSAVGTTSEVVMPATAGPSGSFASVSDGGPTATAPERAAEGSPSGS